MLLGALAVVDGCKVGRGHGSFAGGGFRVAALDVDFLVEASVVEMSRHFDGGFAFM